MIPYEPRVENVKPAGESGRRDRSGSKNSRMPIKKRGLENTGLTLQPTDIFNDLIDVLRHYTFNLRHISKVPVVGTDAGRSGTLERNICVMVRLINLMNQGRAL